MIAPEGLDRLRRSLSPCGRSLRRRCQGLPDDPRVPSGDSQQGEAGSLGTAAPLLPALQRADADSEGRGELHLCEPDEGAQVGDVLAGPDVPGHQPLPLRLEESSLEVLFAQLWDLVGHRQRFMWRPYRRRSAGVAQRAEITRMTSSTLSVPTTSTSPPLIKVNRADGDEPLLDVRVPLVEQLQSFVGGIEDRDRLIEAQAVLLLVGAVLLRVPLDLHRPDRRATASIRQ